MPFFQSLGAKLGVEGTLESMGINPEASTRIGRAATYFVAWLCADEHIVVADEHNEHIVHDHSVHLLEELNITIDSEELNHIKNEMQHTRALGVSFIENQKNNALHGSDNNEIEAIFAQIDLAQARITKDQEEIQSLEKETNELLSQLEYMAS